jgi:hypothetical protein
MYMHLDYINKIKTMEFFSIETKLLHSLTSTVVLHISEIFCL